MSPAGLLAVEIEGGTRAASKQCAGASVAATVPLMTKSIYNLIA